MTAPDPQELMRRLREYGSLEGDLKGRYSKLKRLIPLIQPGQWLYYTGASTLKRSPNAPRFSADLFEVIGLPIGLLPFEASSGHDVLSAGYTDTARKIAERVALTIRSAAPCGIICGSPQDAWMFQNLYPEWDLDLDLPIVQASIFFSTLVGEGILDLCEEVEGVSSLFHASVGSDLWLQDLPQYESALQALYGDGPHTLPEPQHFCEPQDDQLGWSPLDEGPFESRIESLWQAVVESEADLLITDDPFTYEALYNRADETGVWVKDFCQVLAEHVIVDSTTQG
jgi:hypothetical protein